MKCMCTAKLFILRGTHARDQGFITVPYYMYMSWETCLLSCCGVVYEAVLTQSGCPGFPGRALPTALFWDSHSVKLQPLNTHHYMTETPSVEWLFWADNRSCCCHRVWRYPCPPLPSVLPDCLIAPSLGLLAYLLSLAVPGFVLDLEQQRRTRE